MFIINYSKMVGLYFSITYYHFKLINLKEILQYLTIIFNVGS